MLILLFLNGFCLIGQNKLSTTVEFVVNTDNIIPNEKYSYYMDVILPVIKQNDVESILLVGSASPEGNKERNKYLAKIRAEKIYSYFKDVIPENKIEVVNNYDLFLQKTGFTEKDYKKLRATYIEVYTTPKPIRDTIHTRDTIYHYEVYTLLDTIYLKPKIIPILAVKTNLASDITTTLNAQAELYTHLWGLSLEFDYTFPWWHKDYDDYFYYQILNGTTGIRKYINNKYIGHWIGIYANTAIYDICFWNKDKGWQGELYGAGIGYGYIFQNQKYPRLKFEPYIRVGWFNTKFDTYHASQPWNEKYYYNWYLKASDFVPRRFKMNYFGPTEIGFNFTFDLICLRKY